MEDRSTLKIESYWPPALVTLSNKTYAMPGWIEVPNDTTVKEISKCWVNTIPKSKSGFEVEQKVTSSNGKQIYIVKCKNDQWTCNCVGFGFRKTCKHIKTVQK